MASCAKGERISVVFETWSLLHSSTSKGITGKKFIGTSLPLELRLSQNETSSIIQWTLALESGMTLG